MGRQFLNYIALHGDFWPIAIEPEYDFFSVMENLLFKSLLVLAPLPTAVIFYRYLNAQSSDGNNLEGSFGQAISFKFGGTFLTYLLVLFFFVICFYPSYIGLNLQNETTKWQFQIEYRVSANVDAPIQTRSGQLSVTKLPGHAGKFSGWYERQAEIPPDELRWDAEGLFGASHFLIPVHLPNVDRNVAAVGAWDPKEAKATLKLFSLADEETSIEPIYGLMTLKQSLPWAQFFIVFFVPLVVVIGVSRLGELAENVIELKKPFGPLSDMFGNLSMKVAGITSVYVAVAAICYVVFFNGLPRSALAETETYTSAMKRYNETWYYRLFHTGNGFVDHTARMEVSAEELTGIRVSGRMSALWLAKKEGFNCYETTVESSKQMELYQDWTPELRWKSDIAAIVDGTLIIIYRFIGRQDDNAGVLYASLLDGESKGRWGFYDFSKWRSDTWTINSGYVAAFRPDDTSKYDDECLAMISKFHQASN